MKENNIKHNPQETFDQSANNNRVHGKPLQTLYAKLRQFDGCPSQPVLVRDLSHSLEKRGLQYHPRTVKRQLLGNIEYIPEILEKVFLEWIEAQQNGQLKKLITDFQKNKKELESSEDFSLYVSPKLFTRMADGYLYLHKQLTRRQLALQLQSELKQKKIDIGLETLQAALGGKTQKIRKVIEDELKQLYLQDGYQSQAEILAFIENAEKNGGREIKKVDLGNIAEVIDAYLLKTEGLSKRQLAIRIKDRLEKKGYKYHLSSLQSVIEGKTRKTKKVILETFHEIFKEEGLGEPGSLQNFFDSLPETQRHWHQYVNAEKVPSMVNQILEGNPPLTRRQLALILREDLSEKKFNFSLNTLQYILSGKSQKIRGIVFELLEDYLKNGEIGKIWETKKDKLSAKKGRPSLSTRLTQTFEKMSHAEGEERESLLQSFLETRAELIKRRWSQKHRRRTRKYTRRWKPQTQFFDEIDPNDSFPNGESGTDDLSVAYEREPRVDRLVS